jgi:H+-translocating NAD(P) transhydrogenase subunit alpha
MPVRLSVPKENASGERRVALDPTVAARFAKMGLSVQIEKDAGAAARFPDAAYADAGLLDAAEVYAQADIMVRVAPRPLPRSRGSPRVRP